MPDNKQMEQIAKDGVFEFLWIYVPTLFAGATGSTGNANAIN